MNNPNITRRRPLRSQEDKTNEQNIDVKLEQDNNEVSSTSFDKQGEMSSRNGNQLELDHSFDEPSEDKQLLDTADNLDEPLDTYEIPERTLPSYNVPEKIVLVYDSAIDEVSTGFKLNGETICPNAMLKRSLRFFLYNKSLIDPRHEFALVVINDNSVVWLKEFTNNIETIINVLDDIPSCEPEDILVLDNLFQLIGTKVKLPETKENFNVPPPYIVRVIFTYGRSFTLPQLDETKAVVTSIVNSPYFTFDILMTHEMPSCNNHCIRIFQKLQLIDSKGFAYFFPVGRSASQLHLSMAKLLGHPLQRAIQRAANYSINAMEV